MKTLLMTTALMLTMAGGAFAADDTSDTQRGPRFERGEGMRKDRMPPHMKADANKDGVLTKAEMQAEFNERFSEMDANNDGQVTREELKAAHKKHMKEMKARRAEMKEKRGDDEGRPRGRRGPRPEVEAEADE